MALEVLFLIGRIIIGLYFIMSGFNHFTHMRDIASYATSKKIPVPKFSVFISGAFLLLGGLSLLLGIYPVIGVILVITFLLPAAFFVHNFWTMQKEQRQMNMINFMKNLALVGAALMFLGIQTPWPLSLGPFLF